MIPFIFGALLGYAIGLYVVGRQASKDAARADETIASLLRALAETGDTVERMLYDED